MPDCPQSRSIFIVYGHDTGAEDEVTLVIERLGLRAIILYEQSDTSKTLVEKVERHADVGFAVVILTPGDLGYSKHKTPKAESRARRNLVLDLCYFLGKLGRSRVCALLKGEVEIPAEIADVLYMPMDDTGRWQIKLAKALRAAGMDLEAVM